MIIRLKKASDVPSHEITSESVYINRRAFMAAAAATAGAALLGSSADAAVLPEKGAKFPDLAKGYSKLGSNDALTPFNAVTGYNNFYEFGTDKEDPAKNSSRFKPLPWTVKVEGMCAHPGTLDLDDFLKPHTAEERVYRHRCVEAWSMVIPWVGISLADVIKRFEPLGSAKFVQFDTIVRPAEMPGQRSEFILPWPYVEGLRLDEAMNPLAILAIGVYGQALPNQNGAPLRLVAPWKYGFKNGKSIVRISFTDRQPKNTWQVMNAHEYGFYANVNPNVDHPRWSQASERRLGGSGGLLSALTDSRRPTLMFNGYQEEVAQLYADMDLAKNY